MLTYEDGRAYRGNFVNGQKHGTGEELLPDGAKRVGVWDNGKFSKQL